MFSDDQLLPISALEHFIFCARQTALIHLEQAWAENFYTAEGSIVHQKAHQGDDESRPGVRISRSLPLVSRRLGIAGQCDIVEIHESGKVIPIEYKRGKPKSHDADRIQLCAQAICLEEMLAVPVLEGYLFYGKRKRRTLVKFEHELRGLTEKSVLALRQLLAAVATPPAIYEPRKCDNCSLIEYCQPQAFRLKRGAGAWFNSALADCIGEPG